MQQVIHLMYMSVSAGFHFKYFCIVDDQTDVHINVARISTTNELVEHSKRNVRSKKKIESVQYHVFVHYIFITTIIVL